MSLIYKKLSWDIQKKILKFHEPYIFKDLLKKYIFTKLLKLKYNWIFNFSHKNIKFFSTVEMNKYINILIEDGFQTYHLDELICIAEIQKYVFKLEINFNDYIASYLKNICNKNDNLQFVIENYIGNDDILFDMDEIRYVIYNSSNKNVDRHINPTICTQILEYLNPYITEIETFIIETEERVLGLTLEKKGVMLLISIIVNTDLLDMNIIDL